MKTLIIIPLLAIALSAGAQTNDSIEILPNPHPSDQILLERANSAITSLTSELSTAVIQLKEQQELNEIVLKAANGIDDICKIEINSNEWLQARNSTLESSNEVLRAQLAACETDLIKSTLSFTNDGPSRAIVFDTVFRTNTITVTNWVTVTNVYPQHYLFEHRCGTSAARR